MSREVKRAVSDIRNAIREAISASLKLEKAVGIGRDSKEEHPSDMIYHNNWFDVVGIWAKNDNPKGRRYKASLAISNTDMNSWVYLSDPKDRKYTDTMNPIYFKANYHRIDIRKALLKKKRKT